MIKGKIYACIGMMTDPFIPFIHHLRWKMLSHYDCFSGLTFPSRESPVIVSMTSYPDRIATVHLAIQSLMMQKAKADKIILWLSEQEFKRKELDLPQELLELKKYGLSVKWYENIKSYKKLIPTLLCYPDAIVITVDDDLYYSSNLILGLYNGYLANPDVIHCQRVTKFVYDGGSFKRVVGGFDYYERPTYLNKLSGGAGCLYPPNVLNQEVFSKDTFMSLAPTSDDIWFWAMAVLNGTKISVVKNNHPYLHYIRGTQQVGLYIENDRGPQLFDLHLNNVMEVFPLFKKRLVEEARRFVDERW